MDSIRVSAKTVDDAITEASIQLGIPSSELEYDIIEKGSSGFLGIGMKQAVIDVRKKKVQPVVEKVKEEPVKAEPKAEKKEEPKVEKKAEARPEKKQERKPEKKFDNKSEFKKEVKAETKAEVKAESKTEAKPSKKEADLTSVTDETKAVVVEFLGNTLKAMNMEVELNAWIDEEGALSVDMKGDNMGILIGKRGQTLDSLQYLANRVANKHQEGYVRVKLDTEDYRKRRKATLENLAKNIAYKVKRTKKPVSLEPMNPYERRIIHAALQSDKYVTTHSEGEEPYRKIVVSLK